MYTLKSIGAGLSILMIIQVNAQISDAAYGYYNDALLFSQTSPIYGSTARMQGLSGTQVALGADMSVTGTNPAGLGFLNRSVFSFSPSLNIHMTDANYLGNKESASRANFNFANIGVVFHSDKGDYTNETFRGGSFAISVNRINDFNSQVTYQGRNNSSSIIDYYINQAGTTSPENLDDYSYGAYYNYLINPVYDDNGNLTGYDSFVPGNPLQSEKITTNGGQYQFNFAWGGNLSDRIYFGAGVGLATINYSNIRTYREQKFMYDVGGSDYTYGDLNYLELHDRLDITGKGINATLGMIVRPVNILTLGFSYNTPTYYSLIDESGLSSSTSWNNVVVTDNGQNYTLGNEKYTSDIVVGNYNLRTPAKVSAGAALFLGKLGFISADVEMVNYASAQLSSSDFSMDADNETVKNLYQNVVNYRLGAEFRAADFRIRGGYGHMGNPYVSNNQFDGSVQSITAGAGYRSKDYFFDLAVVHMKSHTAFSPYSFSGYTPTAYVNKGVVNITATLGFNF